MKWWKDVKQQIHLVSNPVNYNGGGICNYCTQIDFLLWQGLIHRSTLGDLPDLGSPKWLGLAFLRDNKSGALKLFHHFQITKVPAPRSCRGRRPSSRTSCWKFDRRPWLNPAFSKSRWTSEKPFWPGTNLIKLFLSKFYSKIRKKLLFYSKVKKSIS